MIKERLKDTIIQLESKEIISNADYLDKVYNIIIVGLPGGFLRICLDSLELIKAIQREHYPIATSNEIILSQKFPRKKEVFSIGFKKWVLAFGAY